MKHFSDRLTCSEVKCAANGSDDPGLFLARTGAHVSPPGDLLRHLAGGSALRPAGVF
jgi:hypothetical protein